MKILHVIPSVGPLRGGPSFAMRAIASGLAAQGVETHVATTNDNGHGHKLTVPLGRPIEEEGAIYWYFPRQTSFYLCSLPFAKWLWLHASDYQLIHIHAVFSWCSNVAALIARHKGIPYVIRPLGVLNRWGMQNRRPLLKQLSFALVEKPLLRGAAFIHYTAEQERIEAAECGFSQNPRIIPNPVAPPGVLDSFHRGALRVRYPELSGKRVILFLSRIDRKKGLDLLLPAFQAVLKQCPEAALVIAGDGDAALIASLKTQCRDLSIQTSVYWPGFLTGAAKLDALAEAEMFVLPSYSENFGIAVIEAMAAGLPVVITDQVGIFREVEAGHAGIVTTTEAEPLRRAITHLLTDESYRAGLAKNSVALAQAQFSPGRVIERLIDAYCSVIHPAHQTAVLQP